SMKKKLSRILTMVIMVGMIAAIPASTQILSGGGSETNEDANLPMLVLVNRLELSEEQMDALHDTITGLLEEKEEMEDLRAEFKDVMIEFSGTGEELDELLAAFQEDQQALAEVLRESIEASLDEVRDLLSINQGITLRETLPGLLGSGSAQRTGFSDGRLQHTPRMMENSMPSLPTGRGSMAQQAQRGGQMQSPMQSGRVGGRSGSFGNESMSGMMQERFGEDGMLLMHGEGFGQDLDDVDDTHAMREQLQSRLEQFGDQVPEELREQLEQRFGGTIEIVGQMGRRIGNTSPGQSGMGQLRGRGQIGGNSFAEQQGQFLEGGQGGEHGNLFDLLEQVAGVLELKMEAME
ncbi:hypothetical protein ACFLSZ_07275, partial [Candidatus Bipolaricaulota bacterium]